MTGRRGLRAVAALVGVGVASASWAAPSLLVSAAASLTDAFREVGAAFVRADPARRVTFNFAASGVLVRQAEQGAPVDVLATADAETMARAAAKGLLDPASRRDFASNRLVLVVPAASPTGVRGPRDLAGPAVTRVAVGNPAFVPAGRYARAHLLGAGLWEGLRSKLVLGDSVRQVLDYVVRAEVDAGFVFATDMASGRVGAEVAADVPLDPAPRYPIAVLAGAPDPAGARLFVDFVAGREGREILVRHGFGPP